MKTTELRQAVTDPFHADVVAGLSRPQKRLSAKYFYDAAGSQLFDRITELDEYYPTRTELGIMRKHAAVMAGCCGRRCLLIELGAGSLVKARLLLDRLDRPAGFVPVDVSGEHLDEAARQLARDYPKLPIASVTADFTSDFPLPTIPAARRVVYFPGSTLGNFEPAEADALLRRTARLVGPGGGLLLGVDLRKDVAVDNLGAALQVQLADLGIALANQVFVILHAHRVGMILLRSQNDDTAIATAQIVHLLARPQPPHFEHLVDDGFRRWIIRRELLYRAGVLLSKHSARDCERHGNKTHHSATVFQPRRDRSK